LNRPQRRMRLFAAGTTSVCWAKQAAASSAALLRRQRSVNTLTGCSVECGSPAATTTVCWASQAAAPSALATSAVRWAEQAAALSALAATTSVCWNQAAALNAAQRCNDIRLLAKQAAAECGLLRRQRSVGLVRRQRVRLCCCVSSLAASAAPHVNGSGPPG
jgi:hypothetical protein